VAAVVGGATAIGLIDGNFEGVPAVWHKEILYALSLGVACFGAASMGALRAAECAPFGMVPVGWIANQYLAGAIDDDAAVALISAPAELAYAPLSEPLVDAWATLRRLADLALISRRELEALTASANALFFKDRTVGTIVEGAGLGARSGAIRSAYDLHHVSQKRLDALELLEWILQSPARRSPAPSWTLSYSPFLGRHLAA